MSWWRRFYRHEADVEGAQADLEVTRGNLEKAKSLAHDGESAAQTLRETNEDLKKLHDSNGFAEAIAELYRVRAK